MKIVCTSDKKYLPLLYVLAKSVSVNSPNTHIYARLVSWKEAITDDDVNKLQDIHSLVEVERDDGQDGLEDETFERIPSLVEKFLNTRKKNRLNKQNLPSKKSSFKVYQTLYTDACAYCTNIKFNTLNKLSSYNGSLLYLDADTIVRKDLTPLGDRIQRADIAVVNDTPDLSNFEKGGLIGYNPTSATARKYMREVENQLDIWDITGDEVAMKAAYHIIHPRVERLTVDYKDTGARGKFGDTIMWSGHAGVKSYNQQYIDEQRKYEDSSDNSC